MKSERICPRVSMLPAYFLTGGGAPPAPAPPAAPPPPPPLAPPAAAPPGPLPPASVDEPPVPDAPPVPAEPVVPDEPAAAPATPPSPVTVSAGAQAARRAAVSVARDAPRKPVRGRERSNCASFRGRSTPRPPTLVTVGQPLLLS